MDTEKKLKRIQFDFFAAGFLAARKQAGKLETENQKQAGMAEAAFTYRELIQETKSYV